jgi:tetratricopeptide (TPR) repeat protein
MIARRSLWIVAAGLVGLMPVMALAGAAETAAALVAQGKGLLAKADFEGALKAYAEAAKTDSQNQDYRQQYAVLRRVIQMREGVDKETNDEKWRGTVAGLRAFYYGNDLYGEALALDRKAHTKLKNADSASALAQTQLQMGQNAEAAVTLSALDEKSATPQSQVLLGIALARQGKNDEAKALAGKIETPKEGMPGLLYDLASLHALTGDTAGAAALLTRCFENTPPSRVDAFKATAKQDKDLASMVASADFAKALETTSKVKESACTGGSNCGSCPSKGSCSTASKSACPSEKAAK